MADPVSLIAAGVGISDVAFRVVHYLKDVKSAAKTINNDIALLIDEVEALRIVHGELEQELMRAINNRRLHQREKVLWFQTAKQLQAGQKLVTMLENCVKEVYNGSRTVQGRWDGLRKAHRKKSKDQRISAFRDQIGIYQGSLQICLNVIHIQIARDQQQSQTTQSALLAQIVLSINTLDNRVQQLQDSRNLLHDGEGASAVYQDFASIPMITSTNLNQNIAPSKAVPKTPAFSKEPTTTYSNISSNVHFSIPAQVDQWYAGRNMLSEQLHSWLLPMYDQNRDAILENQRDQPKRFVICGSGGSGKTQFCCKFAEDNRDHFWGVFWLDGCNRQMLQQSFANIATLVSIGQNDHAVLHWLSNLTRRWLLIIDCADDPTIAYEEYYPQSHLGVVLLTTRNLANKILGNVGPGFFELNGLDEHEAKTLLLKASGTHPSASDNQQEVAACIAKSLGFLPIAISQAGAAIREGICKPEDYLQYLERHRERQRRIRNLREDGFPYLTLKLIIETVETRAKHGSQVAMDALQLFATLAFFHNSKIPFDFLRRAVTNRELERYQTEMDAGTAIQPHGYSLSSYWSAWSRGVLSTVVGGWHENPPVLLNAVRTGWFDPDRVRDALGQLTQLSLIKYDKSSDSYSMHQMVSAWARGRGTSLAEQFVWCEAATAILSNCILLPPLGNTIEDEILRRDLLPHIRHVQDCREILEFRMRDKRIARFKPWPLMVDRGMSRERALTFAKFAVVYAQNGFWEDAERLQIKVKDWLVQTLGLEHPAARRMTLALSNTLAVLGQLDEAACLRTGIYNVCNSYLGHEHHETLVVKHSLGEIKFFQGYFREAEDLQEEAVNDLIRLHGIHHEDTLSAIDSLGRTILSFQNTNAVSRAREMHRLVTDEMQRLHGQSHLQTLAACENLCTTAVHSGEHDELIDAKEMMTIVIENLTTKLGKEHAMTLFATMTLGLIKSGLNDHVGAEGLILTALSTAERNLGHDHPRVLWGRYILGKVMVRQGRWRLEEAETILSSVTSRQRDILQGLGARHPNRLEVLLELGGVYNVLGKYQESDRIMDEVLEGYSSLAGFGEGHPVVQKLRETRGEWEKQRAKVPTIEVL